jgi:hypothetical protein
MTQTINSFSITEGELQLDSGRKVTFLYPIIKAVEFDNIFVVMLDVPPGAHYNENVFGVDADGNIIWQIEKLPSPYPDTIYVSLNQQGDKAKLNNYDGSELVINPATGQLINKRFVK